MPGARPSAASSCAHAVLSLFLGFPGPARPPRERRQQRRAGTCAPTALPTGHRQARTPYHPLRWPLPGPGVFPGPWRAACGYSNTNSSSSGDSGLACLRLETVSQLVLHGRACPQCPDLEPNGGPRGGVRSRPPCVAGGVGVEPAQHCPPHGQPASLCRTPSTATWEPAPGPGQSGLPSGLSLLHREPSRDQVWVPPWLPSQFQPQ